MTFDGEEIELEDKVKNLQLEKLEEMANKIASAIEQSKTDIDLSAISTQLKNLKPQDMTPLVVELKTSYERLINELSKKINDESKLEAIISSLVSEIKSQQLERTKLLELVSKIKGADYSKHLSEIKDALVKGSEEWVFEVSRDFNNEVDKIKAVKIK